MTLHELKISSFLIQLLSGDEASYRRIESRSFDLEKAEDAKVLLRFLNEWGCRQFALYDHEKASDDLKKWFIKYRLMLPAQNLTLIDQDDNHIIKYSELFDSLQNSYASTNKNGRIKTVGPVGAAKILFALRKNMFPPWDNPIINLNKFSRDGAGYAKYLFLVKSELQSLETECRQKKILLSQVPVLFDREHVSLVKLVDEYFWLTITRGCNLEKLIRLAKNGI